MMMMMIICYDDETGVVHENNDNDYDDNYDNDCLSIKVLSMFSFL